MAAANTLGPRRFFEHISQNYENEYWEFEKKLGFGGFGYTVLLKRKGSSVQPPQRMAVKFTVGTSSTRTGSLKTEIDMLKKFNGASHIVSLLASCIDIANPAPSQHSGEASDAFEGFVGIEGPALAMEYLEYGDIAGIINKIRPTDRNVPNTVLWSFFCCSDAPPTVIRASVGLAYPPDQPVGNNAQILEELPSGHSPAKESYIGHHDFNPRNIMLAVDSGPEHGIGVKAKLIDFGLAFVQRNCASPRNIFDAAQWLDPELRDFLARCMYVDEAQRPKLQEALQVAQNAVNSKTAMSFPVPAMETESAIEAFVQEFIFNVPQQ
ncbi:kinase-like protein [Nemania sp. FL0031]|nr:kinase-like protein [Nemania sp. FL0031]